MYMQLVLLRMDGLLTDICHLCSEKLVDGTVCNQVYSCTDHHFSLALALFSVTLEVHVR
jgi:hypothetical protein